MPKHFAEIRAYIQCARICFNISGIEDEAMANVLSYPNAIETKPVGKFNPEVKEETIQGEIISIIEEEDFEIPNDILQQANELFNETEATK